MKKSKIDTGENFNVEDKAIKAQAFPTATSSLIQVIQATLEDSKAEDIVVIDLQGKSDMADYMVVASGRSERHVVSIAHRLSDAVKQSGLLSVVTEGEDAGHWVLVDTGDVIVHVFKPDMREYYNLEKMWAVPMAEAEPVA